MYSIISYLIFVMFPGFSGRAQIESSQHVTTGIMKKGLEFTQSPLFKASKYADWNIFHETMPIPLMDIAVVFTQNRIFVIGGYSADSASSVSTNFMYDFSTESWTSMAPIPIDLCMYDAVAVGDTIYIPGGYSYSLGIIVDTLFKYSISSNTWTTGPGTGDTAWFYSVVTVNNKIYRIGGYNNSQGVALNSTWEYDPSTGRWSRKADMPYSVELMARWVRGDTIFIAGGTDGSTTEKLTAFYVVSTDSWRVDTSVFANLPEGIWGCGSALYNDTMYLFAGVDTTWNVSPKVFYFDDVSNSWNLADSLPLPVYRTDGLAISGLGEYDGVYAFGGSTFGFNPTDTIQTTATGYSKIEERTINITTMVISKNISISLVDDVTSIAIYDIYGKSIARISSPSRGKYTFNNIPPGIYFMRMETNNDIQIRRFVVVK